MTSICILNLSAPRIDPVPFSFADSVMKTSVPAEIPAGEPLVLYVVAHGIPDGLLVGTPPVQLSEAELVGAIKHRRGEVPTLIVWDLCFAKTFLNLDGVSWPQNYAHLFSCEAHERTWHEGERAGGQAPQSLFSKHFEQAIQTCKQARTLSWPSLEEELQRLFGRIQHPTVSVPARYDPELFIGN